MRLSDRQAAPAPSLRKAAAAFGASDAALQNAAREGWMGSMWQLLLAFLFRESVWSGAVGAPCTRMFQKTCHQLQCSITFLVIRKYTDILIYCSIFELNLKMSVSGFVADWTTMTALDGVNKKLIIA